MKPLVAQITSGSNNDTAAPIDPTTNGELMAQNGALTDIATVSCETAELCGTTILTSRKDHKTHLCLFFANNMVHSQWLWMKQL